MKRWLPIVLWSVLVTAGLGFAPGMAAYAHTGHAHATPSHQTAASSHDSTSDRAVSREQASRITPAVDEISTPSSDGQPDAVAGACNGACCTTGFSCCGHAMTSIPMTLGPPGLRGLALAMRAEPSGPGIDPEALPKPPKFFA